MSYGEFARARAAARPSASAAGGAAGTQPRLPALPQGRMSPPVARQGRRSGLTPIPLFVQKLDALLGRTLLPRRPGPKPKAKQEAKRN